MHDHRDMFSILSMVKSQPIQRFEKTVVQCPWPLIFRLGPPNNYKITGYNGNWQNKIPDYPGFLSTLAIFVGPEFTCI